MVHSKSIKSDVFSYKCTRQTFVQVIRLYQSDVCTSPTFVLVWRLYCPTFVASDVCAADVCTGTDYSRHPVTSTNDSEQPVTNTNDSGHPVTRTAYSGHPVTSTDYSGHPVTSTNYSGHPVTSIDYWFIFDYRTVARSLCRWISAWNNLSMKENKKIA